MAKAVVINSSVGTGTAKDFTSPGFGTPSGAIILIGWATTIDTETSGASLATVFWDGANTFAVANASEDSQDTTDTERNITDGSFRIVDPPGDIDAIGTISSTTDGITLAFSTNQPSADHLCTVVLIPSGKSLQAGYIRHNLGSVGDTWTYSGASFEFDIALFASYGPDAAPGGARSDAVYSMGVCINDGSLTQRLCLYHDDSSQAISAMRGQIRNDAIAGYGQLSTIFEVIAATSTGFTIERTLDTTVGSEIFLLIGGVNDMSLDDTAIPTSTGVKSWEGPGFQADFLLNVQSGLAAVNTFYLDQDTHFSVGVTDGTTERSFQVFSKDNADISNTGTRVSSDLISFTGWGGTYADTVTASFDSSDSLGYNIDYTAIAAGAQGDLGFTLAVQWDAPVAGAKLYHGGAEVSSVSYGSTSIASIYHGSTQIFP